jgi:hypothetical protein
MSHAEDPNVYSNRPVLADDLVGYDIVGGRKGLYYDATKLLSYVC